MKFIQTLAVAIALAGAASAQDEAIIRSVTLADLEQLASDEGHEVLGYGEAGDISVRASTPDGLVYFLSGTVCQDERCAGINMSSRFEADASVTLEKVNQANLNRAAVSVWLHNGTSLGVSRYVILDGGMTPENVRVNLENFISIVPGIVEMFYEQ